MPKPLAFSLAIVIPAYNEENHLKVCLESLAAQTVTPDEVIVVDNNSTDRTREIVQDYPFVRLLSEKRQGIVYARNRGFNAVKSRFIGRIDSDTILPSNWVERVRDFYSEKTYQKHALTGGGYFYNVRFSRFNGWVQGQLAYRFIRLVIRKFVYE